MAQILSQNTDLSDKIAEEYQTPSQKLKKDDYGLGHKDSLHLYAPPTQLQRKNSSQHRQILLMGRTIFQKEGVKVKTTTSTRG